MCHNHIRFYWPKANVSVGNGRNMLVLLVQMAPVCRYTFF